MATQDLTTYTEVDVAANRVAVTAAAATVTNLDRDEAVRVIFDFGASHFDALDIDFEFNFTGSAHGTLTATGGAILLTYGVRTGFTGLANDEILLAVVVITGPIYKLHLRRGNNVVEDVSIGLSTDTVYYCTMSRSAGGDTVTVTIYSDSARSSVVDTIAVSGFSTTTYRYLYAMMGANNAGTAVAIDYVVGNIDLNDAVPNGSWWQFMCRRWQEVNGIPSLRSGRSLRPPAYGKLATGGMAI